MSGHRKKLTKQQALTNWRPQREGLVRTWKESNQAMGTYKLEITEGEACQEMERKLTKQWALTSYRPQREGLVRTQKKATKQWVLTSWRPQGEGLVRPQNKSDQVMGTHKLETPEGETCQDTERKGSSNRHLLA